MIMLTILTTSLMHFSLKGWENVLFELRSERVRAFCLEDTELCNENREGRVTFAASVLEVFCKHHMAAFSFELAEP